MGTSQSSKGSPSSVPLVPPWVSNAVAGAASAPAVPPSTQTLVLAPPARFGAARRSLGEFAATGAKDSMKLGVGQYFKRGLGGGGGGGAGAARFGGTASTAGKLNAALAGLSGRATQRGDVVVDRSVFEGRDVADVVRAVVEAVRPVDGTQDAEASREAIGESLAELLKTDPKADLQRLTDEQRLQVVQEFIARDIFHRLVLDVGGAIKARAASPKIYLKRLDQILSYLRQGIAAAFRRLSTTGQKATRSHVTELSRRAISDALGVFEEYIA